MLHSSVQEQNQLANNTTSATANNINFTAGGNKTSQSNEIRSLAASQLEKQHNGQSYQRGTSADSETLCSSTGGPAAERNRSSSNRTRLKDPPSTGSTTNKNIMHSNEDSTAVFVSSGIEARHRRCGSSSSGNGNSGNGGVSRGSHRRKPSSSSAKASSEVAPAVSPKNPNCNTSDTGGAKSHNALATGPAQTPTSHQRNLQSHQSSTSTNTTKNRSSTNLKKHSRDRSDDERLSIAADSTDETKRHRRRRSRRISKHSVSSSTSSSSSASSTASSCNGSCSSDDGDSSTSSGEPNLPYPGFPEVALKYLTQDTRPRNWCLMLITNPYPFEKKKNTETITRNIVQTVLHFM